MYILLLPVCAVYYDILSVLFSTISFMHNTYPYDRIYALLWYATFQVMTWYCIWLVCLHTKLEARLVLINYYASLLVTCFSYLFCCNHTLIFCEWSVCSFTPHLVLFNSNLHVVVPVKPTTHVPLPRLRIF